MALTEEQSDIAISRVRHESYFEMKKEHYHTYYEFYYLLSGSRKFFLNNKIYHVNSGDLVVIPKGEIHRTSFVSEGVHERIALCFSDEAVSALKNEIGEAAFRECFRDYRISIPANRREYLEGLFDRLLAEAYLRDKEDDDGLSEALCRRYCEEIILFVIRCQRHAMSERAGGGEHTDISGRQGRMEQPDTEMESAALYMSRHYYENITLKKMADFCCMSESHFSKRFRQQTGFGFKEYLNEVRMRNACELLANTCKSVTEIASLCGFMDSNYFGDAFKKKKGMSPRQYRKINSLFGIVYPLNPNL
ncbi:MAG: AraC family transcriptional regulator [Roseburia sp.]|nr:AraC family transcriptional regulator [Roseburia sp.]